MGIGQNAPVFNYCVRFICEVVTQWQNVQHLNSPYVAILQSCAPGTTPSVAVARNSYAHAHIHLHINTVPNSEVEILNILKLP